MNTAITIIQLLLTLLLTIAGLLKLTQPYTKFVTLPAQGWSNDFKPAVIRLIGLVEVCAAVGIILPLFMPALTPIIPLAAVGMALMMAGAMVTHLRREEYPNMVGNLIWLGLALFVAYSKLVGFAA